MAREALPDRWHSRDFPVLREAARLLDESGRVIDGSTIAAALDMAEETVAMSLVALEPTYIQGKAHRSMGGDVHLFVVTGLTDRGRRATGLWPDEEAGADALVDLLAQAADQSTDEDDAGALRKAGRLLRGVPSAVIADVTAALIRQQTGI